MDNDSNTMCRPCAVCSETRPESFKVWFDGYVRLHRCSACGFEKVPVVTGRWQYKYAGRLKPLGKVLDPLPNAAGIGGILYVGIKR